MHENSVKKSFLIFSIWLVATMSSHIHAAVQSRAHVIAVVSCVADSFAATSSTSPRAEQG